MATSAKAKAKGGAGVAAYQKLIDRFRLRPIGDDATLDEATALAHELSMRTDMTEEEDEYLDVLSRLIEDYEAVHYPIDDASGPDMLRYLMEQKGVSQAEVSGATGLSKSTISEILSGKRAISRKHLEAFSAYFNISPAVFLHSPKVPGGEGGERVD